MVVTYQAGENGYRAINVPPESHRARTLRDFDTPVEGIAERPLLVGAMGW